MILDNVHKFPDQTAIKFNSQSYTWLSLKDAIDHTAEKTGAHERWTGLG